MHLHLICQHYTIHEVETAPAEDFITGMRSRFGRCFLWGAICSKDNSGHIVPTAWLVSLSGDSSAFLKALSLWLGALFRHPWCFEKLHGSVTCTASQIPQVCRDPKWKLKDLLEIKVRQQSMRPTLLSTCPNSPPPASHRLVYRSWFSLQSIKALGTDDN